MTDQPTWQDVVVSARRTASALAAELTAGPRGAARRIGLPDPALTDELATAVDELVEVVLVQQDLIENLLTRVSLLERTVFNRGGGQATG
jgi:hypothetical protein